MQIARGLSFLNISREFGVRGQEQMMIHGKNRSGEDGLYGCAARCVRRTDSRHEPRLHKAVGLWCASQTCEFCPRARRFSKRQRIFQCGVKAGSLLDVLTMNRRLCVEDRFKTMKQVWRLDLLDTVVNFRRGLLLRILGCR